MNEKFLFRDFTDSAASHVANFVSFYLHKHIDFRRTIYYSVAINFFVLFIRIFSCISLPILFLPFLVEFLSVVYLILPLPPPLLHFSRLFFPFTQIMEYP